MRVRNIATLIPTESTHSNLYRNLIEPVTKTFFLGEITFGDEEKPLRKSMSMVYFLQGNVYNRRAAKNELGLTTHYEKLKNKEKKVEPKPYKVKAVISQDDYNKLRGGAKTH